MDLLLVVSSKQGGAIAHSLARACVRAGARFGVFFNDDGVHALEDAELLKLVEEYAEEASVCAQAWKDRIDAPCPIEVGSQFVHAGYVSAASKVVTL